MEPVWSKKQKPLRKTKNESFAHLLVGYDTDPYVFLFKDGRKLPSRVRTRLEPMCFNEATHSRAWKPLCDQETSSRVTVLQWSHALTRVETALVPNSAKTIVTVALASASLAHPIILPLECTCSKLSPTY